jgi:hypothetical protein
MFNGPVGNLPLVHYSHTVSGNMLWSQTSHCIVQEGTVDAAGMKYGDRVTNMDTRHPPRRVHNALLRALCHCALRWDPPFPSRAYKPSSLEDSKIEKLLALNQQVGKILLDLDVA